MVGYTELFFSKKDQGARTPSGLLKQLKEMFLPPGVNFFDPVPHGWSPTNNTNWDALRDPWEDFNFINPPFDQTGKFFQRAIAQEEKCVSFFLVPCRFHTRYFFKAAPHMRHVFLIKNKIRFVGYKQPLPVAMCIVVFGKQFDNTIRKHQELTVRPQEDMFLFPMENGSTMEDLVGMCPLFNLEIGTNVSEPLNEVMNIYPPPISITMPSRLENKVVFEKIVMNPTVKMVFFNPTVDKLFNGTLLALCNALPRNEELFNTLKIPLTVIISIDTTHSEEELATVITPAPI